jgi:predicted metal-dependent hydrolase
MITDTIEINDLKYIVKIHYERRNNSRASINKNAVNIRIPVFLDREERVKQILQMKSWAIKKLQEHPDKFRKESEKEYHDGDVLKIGEEEYTLKIEFRDKVSSSARIIDNVVYLTISSSLSKELGNKRTSSLLSRIIARKRLPKLKEKIHELNEQHFNRTVNKIFFKNNRSNWGSCSSAGNINISTRLLFAPDEVLEYVCVHELAHLIEHNHSDRFWKLVQNAMPDYKEKIRWIKENGSECKF